MAKKQSKSIDTKSINIRDESIKDQESDLDLPKSSDSESESDEDLGSDSDSNSDIDGLDVESTGHTVNKTITEQAPNLDKSKKSKQRGIIYIGRLPSKFQESELRTYFEQFGPIVNVRLSRNKKTGKSKHYGYIEFESVEVAKIASETMDNYLLFNHLIKCKLLSNESEIHQDLFKNANKKYKVIPWQKISKEKYEKPKTKDQWEKIVEKFEQSKVLKQQELKSKGIDFDLSNI